jgi:hypothetical protein
MGAGASLRSSYGPLVIIVDLSLSSLQHLLAEYTGDAMFGGAEETKEGLTEQPATYGMWGM